MREKKAIIIAIYIIYFILGGILIAMGFYYSLNGKLMIYSESFSCFFMATLIYLFIISQIISEENNFCSKIYTNTYAEINQSYFDCYSFGHLAMGSTIYGLSLIIVKLSGFSLITAHNIGISSAITTSIIWEYTENTVLMNKRIGKKYLKHLNRKDSVRNMVSDSLLVITGSIIAYLSEIYIGMPSSVILAIIFLLLFLISKKYVKHTENWESFIVNI
ncbi:MAG: DUF2585 family protein [Candidatus Helarchaeota archaeon]